MSRRDGRTCFSNAKAPSELFHRGERVRERRDGVVAVLER